MPRCLISFGANIGDSLATIKQAAKGIREYLGCRPAEFQLSRFFHTPPVGGPVGQPPFVNAVAAMTTERSEWEVWQAVRDVEQQLGRERIKRWEARRIDLDILLFDDLRLWTPQLKIPHPRMCMRRFILEPALDVAADWIDPVSCLSIQQLANRLRGSRGNLILCAKATDQPQALLAEVAHGSLAEYRLVQRCAEGFVLDGVGDSRWVAWLAAEDIHKTIGRLRFDVEPKLLMFLISAGDSSGGQWEDVHRELATSLRLTASSVSDSGESWALAGARYLLATDDRAWAVHEMSAALEAMDCPVEPLSID